jgi:hypothetical protein
MATANDEDLVNRLKRSKKQGVGKMRMGQRSRKWFIGPGKQRPKDALKGDSKANMKRPTKMMRIRTKIVTTWTMKSKQRVTRLR